MCALLVYVLNQHCLNEIPIFKCHHHAFCPTKLYELLTLEEDESICADIHLRERVYGHREVTAWRAKNFTSSVRFFSFFWGGQGDKSIIN
jgi:hypothetical protein